MSLASGPNGLAEPVQFPEALDKMHASLDGSGLAPGRQVYDVLVRFEELAGNETRFVDLMTQLTEIADAVHEETQYRKGLEEQVTYDLMLGLPVVGFAPFKTEDGHVYYHAKAARPQGKHADFVASLRLPEFHNFGTNGAIEVVPTITQRGRAMKHGNTGTDFPEDR